MDRRQAVGRGGVYWGGAGLGGRWLDWFGLSEWDS